MTMSDGFLSQDEIDALLRGEPAAETPAASSDEGISEMEKDALGEIGNISMGSAATTLSILLGRRVSITTPKVSLSTLEQIQSEYPLPYLVVEVGYTNGLMGTNMLAIREQDALVIADLMMGNDGTNPPQPPLNELYMSAVGEAMNQMMGSVATSMSTVFNKKIDISPPQVNLVDFSSSMPITKIVDSMEVVIKVCFRMEVEDLIDSEIMQVLPLGIAKEIVGGLLNPSPAPEAAPAASAPPPAPPPEAAPAAAASAPPEAASPAAAPPDEAYARQPAPAAAPPRRTEPNVPAVAVQPVQFAQLTPAALPVDTTNIGLLLDVPLQVTVELGRTKKSIKEILELTPGSVVELDKLAGEAVDILVNGKLLAKGEVVVIDENFGVRVTDIVSPVERVATIQ